MSLEKQVMRNKNSFINKIIIVQKRDINIE